jgi:hypothetical protein
VNLEQEFLISNTGNVDRVHVRFAGILGLSTSTDGGLEIATEAGTLKETAPTFRAASGSSQSLSGRFMTNPVESGRDSAGKAATGSGGKATGKTPRKRPWIPLGRRPDLWL